MKVFIYVLFILTSISLHAQDEKPVESKITNVTVFLNRAQVTREVKTRIETGKIHLVLQGLTSQLDAQSIQVAGKGAFTILGISHRQNYLNEFNTPKPLKVLRDSLEYVQRLVTLETNKKDILSKEEQLLLNNQKIGGANQNLTVAELKAMADFYRNRLTEIASSRITIDQNIKKLNEKSVKLQRQLNEQNELYSRNTSEVVISVSADAPGNAEFTVNYIVANAGWYALYDLRALNTKSPIQLSYKANVFQSTGEEWRNVKLKLSTANPGLGGLKPELYTWYIDFNQPRYVDKRAKLEVAGTMHRSAPEAEANLQEVIIDEAKPAATISQYVSAIETSLNTEFDIAIPYTVSSSNKPTVVDIRNHELKADYTHAATPKLDLDAFLLARVTGWEDFSLLPGEANVFFEGTFVGKSYIDPNSTKDTLSVSLGRDKRIVVKREKVKDFSSRKVIGANQRESFAYEITIRNTKNENVKLTVEDQIPVSQNSQIEVTMLDQGGSKYNKETGRLAWELSLLPNESKKVVYKFEVKYPKDRMVTGL